MLGGLVIFLSGWVRWVFPQRTIRLDLGGRNQGAYSSMSEWADRDSAGKTLGIDIVYNYFTYDYEDSAFYRYFARSL